MDKPYSLPEVRTACLVPEALQAGLNAARRGDPALRPALARLLRDAEEATAAGPFSVMNKEMVPPTGSRHDYLSLGIYLWPDTNTPDGLPYVPRDGLVNPEVSDYDRPPMLNMQACVETLALAWAVTGQERYAERAARLLRAWFLDRATRMNPNMLCAQWIPGAGGFRTPFPARRVPGVGGRPDIHVCFGGVIEGCSLPAILDTVDLLRWSDAWTNADHAALQGWFGAFMDWLLTHQHGKDEAGCPNNHASWYCVQVAAYALFCGRERIAHEWLTKHARDRIALQIEPDGSQPHEQTRAIALLYTTFGLQSFFNMALLGERIGVDLWHYETEGGRGLRRALAWMLPFLGGEREWPYRQVKPYEWHRAIPLLCAGAYRYGDERCAHALANLNDVPPDHSLWLLFHVPEGSSCGR